MDFCIDDQNMQIMHSIVDSSCCQENTLQFSLVDILHNLNLKQAGLFISVPLLLDRSN